MAGLEERFWSKVDKTGDCWNWTAHTRNGYGRISKNGRLISAHRLSYELHCGEIPEKMKVLHRCDNPTCVNPDHLFIGTQSDNINDMMDKDRATIVRGEEFPQSKLTEQDVIKIRKIYDLGLATQTTLGVLFGVSNQLISRVVNNQIWSHVDGEV